MFLLDVLAASLSPSSIVRMVLMSQEKFLHSGSKPPG